MKTHILTLALAASCVLSGTVFAQEMSAPVKAQMSAIRSEKDSRTASQRKLASRLLYLTREAKGLPAVAGAPDMKSRVELDASGRVEVDISAVPSADLKAAIIAAGGVVIYESPRWSSVRASVPPAALTLLAARADVKSIAKGSKAITHAVTNEADPAHKANTSRPAFGVDGTGIKVGVLSDSDDHSEASIASGELPASLWSVLPGDHTGRPGSGEGTAMSEIVHDIAPGAQIIFAAAGPGKAGFGDAIVALQAAGCSIIVDDISYGDEWQFQDDEIGQAVNAVVAAGAIYLSSSGNEGNLKRGNSTTWEGDFNDGGANALIPGGTVHSFGTKNYNRLTKNKSGATLQWSDEANSSANEYDLYVLNAAGSSIVSSSTNPQTGTQTPYEEVENVKVGERIVIWKATGAAARYLRLSCTGSPLEFQTAGQTIGHAATANCICVASSDATINLTGFTTASVLDDPSSDGPHKMFYNPNGTPITPGNFLASGGITIPSPALTAGDGGKTSVPGFAAFYGTSASAPAAAAIAALVWQRNPALTNDDLRTVLETSCLDIESPGREINSGFGILMADLALANSIAQPEIAVEQPALTNLESGGSRSVGSTEIYNSKVMTFTIRNLGSASLTGLAGTFTGADAADFSVSKTATAPVAALTGSTTLSIRFNPITAGAKAAVLHIASNDADEADFTITLTGVATDPDSIGRDDTVISTTGETRIRPLANDNNAGGSLTITAVSDPSITIDGTSLIIPEGYVGTFSYTVSDGTIMTDVAAVTVIAGTPIAAPSKWGGLLYNTVTGDVAGSVRISRSGVTYTGTLLVGSTSKALSFKLTSGAATINTVTLGTLQVDLEDNGRLTIALSAIPVPISPNPLEGSLRPEKTATYSEKLNIALASDNSDDIPGGGYATATVSTLGNITFAGKLPDGRATSYASRMSDNDSFFVNTVIAGTAPKAVLIGEFVSANLRATDVTGELSWVLPAQTKGIHMTGVDTTLYGNGCVHTTVSLTTRYFPSNGPGVLVISGGDLANDSTANTVVTNGKPSFPALNIVRTWVPNSTYGTFTVGIKDPDRTAILSGSGVYLPKTRSAWGYFPGLTVGGRVQLNW